MPERSFAADEHAHGTAWFGRHLADRTGHRGRAFQLRPEHRLDGLMPGVREAAREVFTALGIQWHPYIGHARSSQAACINMLMPLADKSALLGRWVGALLGTAPPEMLPLEDELAGAHRFVAFEYTGPCGRDWLDECGGHPPKRGAHATAADTAVAFRNDEGGRELLLIEWKYTEQYLGHRLSPDEAGKRVVRYGNKAFAPNGPIRNDLGLALTDFFHEPFYQLLRQQMLAWQIERAGAFDRVRVLHLSPVGNRALHAITAPALRVLDGVPRTDAFAAYGTTLADPGAFLQRTTESAFAPLADWPEADWMPALAERYPGVLGCA